MKNNQIHQYKKLSAMCKLKQTEIAALIWYAEEGFSVINRVDLTSGQLSEPYVNSIIRHLSARYGDGAIEYVFQRANRCKNIIEGGEKITTLTELMQFGFTTAKIIDSLKNKFFLPKDITLYRGGKLREGELTSANFLSTSVCKYVAENFMSTTPKADKPYCVNYINAHKGVSFVAVPESRKVSKEYEVLLFKDTINIKQTDETVYKNPEFNETIVNKIFEVNKIL